MATQKGDKWEKPLGLKFEGDMIIEVEGVRMMKLPPGQLERLMGEGPESFQFLPDDIFLATWPRSGTHWTRAILYLLLHPEDVAVGKFQQNVHNASYMLGSPRVPLDELDNLPSPRFIYTHIPLKLLQAKYDKVKPKTIVVIRNPKDTLVSLYHMELEVAPEAPDWVTFVNRFLTNKNVFGDMFEYLLSWWRRRNDNNILLLRFEDMKVDPEATIKSLAAFCNIEISPGILEKIKEMTSFEAMKNEPNVKGINVVNNPNFIRKGKAGGWKDYFTVKQNEMINELIQKRLTPEGLIF